METAYYITTVFDGISTFELANTRDLTIRQLNSYMQTLEALGYDLTDVRCEYRSEDLPTLAI
jgi:hypothetical protein